MNRITVCKDCAERHLNCHDHCERYIAEHNAWREAKQKMMERQAIDNAVADGSYRRGKMKRSNTQREAMGI